jgi:hypothetical protein
LRSTTSSAPAAGISRVARIGIAPATRVAAVSALCFAALVSHARQSRLHQRLVIAHAPAPAARAVAEGQAHGD